MLEHGRKVLDWKDKELRERGGLFKRYERLDMRNEI
jgi:hypothetical protein